MPAMHTFPYSHACYSKYGQTVPQRESILLQSFSDSLAENLSAFKSELCAPRNEDVITHRFACLGAEAALIFIDGMTDREMTNISVL